MRRDLCDFRLKSLQLIKHRFASYHKMFVWKISSLDHLNIINIKEYWNAKTKQFPIRCRYCCRTYYLSELKMHIMGDVLDLDVYEKCKVYRGHLLDFSLLFSNKLIRRSAPIRSRMRYFFRAPALSFSNYSPFVVIIAKCYLLHFQKAKFRIVCQFDITIHTKL